MKNTAIENNLERLLNDEFQKFETYIKNVSKNCMTNSYFLKLNGVK